MPINSIQHIYTNNYRQLQFVAYNYLRDINKSKDIVQDVFLKLLELDSDKQNLILELEPEKQKAWLFTLIKNKCLDDIKVEKGRNKILSNISTLFAVTSKNAGLENLIYQSLLSEFKELGEREQQILEMHTDGYKNEEIANHYNLSYNTVRNTLYNAKIKLKHLDKLIVLCFINLFLK